MPRKGKRALITAADIESATSPVSVSQDAIITPSARDAAEKRGIQIIRVAETSPRMHPPQGTKVRLSEFCRFIDHTNLSPAASEADIARLCDEAREHGFASVCVAPTRVRLAAAQCKGSQVHVCSVAGFPSGMHATGVKVAEARAAIEDGATEIDMVANAGLLVDDRLSDYAGEITAVRQAIGPSTTLKVIIEASLLRDADIVRAAVCAAQAGADFVKTSTGVYGQAKLEHVRLLRQVLDARVKIKAAGGIKTAAQALAFIEAGADRLGTSSAVQLIQQWRDREIASLRSQ